MNTPPTPAAPSSPAETPRRVIGVDVGGTRTKFGIVGVDGTLALPYSLPTPHDPAELCSLIAHETATTLRDQSALPADTPVGVAVPGILDESRERVEIAMNLGWESLDLGAMLRRELPGPLAFGHDVRAGALAESAWGAGKAFEVPGNGGVPVGGPGRAGAPADLPTLADLVFVPIGTGIAAAVIHDGKLFGDRYTGEIGQVAVTEPFTGAQLRLEAVASASAIGRRYAERVAGSTPDVATDGGRIAAREVVDRARSGDEDAEQILVSALDTLAQALATIVSSVGTVPIVIGGGLAEGGSIVLDTLREAISKRLGVVPTPPVVPSSLGMWAGCLGAGLLALTRATDEAPA